MPVLEDQSFRPSPFLENPHVQTIFPALFRKSVDLRYERERFTLSDGDFLDIDWLKGSNADRVQNPVSVKKVVILLHGLESNSGANYMTRMAYLLNRMGFDVAAVNFRGCSGETNKLFKAYHSGKTDDVSEVVHLLANSHNYDSINLVGFSLGGNVLLKYMGEMGAKAPSQINAAAAISVPCDLASSSQKLQSLENGIYARRFLASLKKKVKEKASQYPSWFDATAIGKINTIEGFDDWYTAPVHGYAHAQDYYSKNSSKSFLPNIQKPTLLLNSLDDPFLTSACMPFEEASENQFMHFMYTRNGGHVGFHSKKLFGLIHWHEKKVISFLLKYV